MHKKFDHKAFESKWQSTWAEKKLYRTAESDKPKTFVLDMFPYPSGEGLHVGHPKGYIATDVYSRFKRMNGHEVLHPMGWDAFGLPAENFAIKHKTHPRVAVEKNVQRFKEQLEVLGFDYDWEREINTTDPGFYKWTQWIFIQLYKKGLAYQSHEPINWCPGCQTGLANEDVEPDGTCERCDTPVEKKPMRQWVLKIRDYADRMLTDLDTLAWPEHIKEAQRNWIGRSEGAEIDFTLSTGDTVTVFTTRPDTLFGATYMVLAPEHALVSQNRDSITNWTEAEAYITEASQKEEMDRLAEGKEKTGVKLEGITATNPANGESVPVYIADYVLAGYGTGAIMAVPAHDERDRAFAEKFEIEITPVISPITGEEQADPESRESIVAIVHNPKTDLYATINWHTPAQTLFVGGGIDAGESVEEAAVREIREETHCEHVTLVSQTMPIEHSYFAHSKGVARKIAATGLLFTLTDEAETEQSLAEDEAEQFEFKWKSAQEIEKEVTDELHKTVWNMLVKNKIHTAGGKLINSGEFDGLDSEEAKQAITDKVRGRMTATYKIKDWVFSRQRYWGEPFPMVHTEDGEVYPVAEEQLPVTLPEVENYEPAGDGQSPLATIDDWVNVTGYVTGAGDFVVADEAPEGHTLVSAKRETNTMPQWAGSSWYYLRFMDPHNSDALVSKEAEQYWAPVDVYVGGDHAVRHLIYARFWHKFLYDIDVVSTIEPFQRLEFLGFILAEDGRKMSKRWGNVINPDDIVEKVGADTMRVYEMFMGPFENTIAWSTDGLVGARRFLERVNGLSEHVSENEIETVTRQLHKTIAKVAHDIEHFKFNTAISSMMVFINVAEKEGLSAASYQTFLQLLAPFAPHLADELWSELATVSGSVHQSVFPTADETLAKDDTVTIGVQINGKVRGEITISPEATEAEALSLVAENQLLQERMAGQKPSKIIYKAGRILNIIM